MSACQSGRCRRGTEPPEDVRARNQLNGIPHKLLVMSCKGGAGKCGILDRVMTLRNASGRRGPGFERMFPFQRSPR